MLYNLHFAEPSKSYFLISTLFIALIFALSLKQKKRALSIFADSESLKPLLFLEKRTFIRYIFLSIAWFFTALALMQPQLPSRKNSLIADKNSEKNEDVVANDRPEKVIAKRRLCDVIFLLDTSASMRVTDTRQKNSRLDCAKEILDEMIAHLDGQNVALYTFTSSLNTVVPPTLDYFFTRLMLRDVGINYGDVAGTDLFEALEGISKKHFKSPSEKQKVVILLTDGGDTELERLSAKEREDQLKIMLSKFDDCEKQNVRIFTIGLGSLEGSVIPEIQFEGQPVISTLDTELLTKLSQKGRGNYFFANDYSSIALAEKITKIIASENRFFESEQEARHKLQRESSNPNTKKIPLFQGALICALLALLFEFSLNFMPTKEKVDS